MGEEGLHTVILLTGSNLEDREENLNQASYQIAKMIGNVLKYSSLFESEPWGNKDQPAFINQALMVSTILSPEKLLQAIHNIEKGMGRTRNQKWEARIIDIDIIFYDDKVIDSVDLNIPHPEFTNRTFAILPVMEIAPEYIHPQNHLTVHEIMQASNDGGEVTKLKSHAS